MIKARFLREYFLIGATHARDTEQHHAAEFCGISDLDPTANAVSGLKLDVEEVVSDDAAREEHKALPPARDLTQPVIGYRAWVIAENGALLPTAQNTQVPYTPRRPALAICSAQAAVPHVAPDHDCRCGIHAFANLATLHAYLDEHYKYANHVGYSPQFAIGRVAMWGRIVQHERGWRAEYAYPQVLFRPQPIEDPRARAQQEPQSASSFAAHDPLTGNMSHSTVFGPNDMLPSSDINAFGANDRYDPRSVEVIAFEAYAKYTKRCATLDAAARLYGVELVTPVGAEAQALYAHRHTRDTSDDYYSTMSTIWGMLFNSGSAPASGLGVIFKPRSAGKSLFAQPWVPTHSPSPKRFPGILPGGFTSASLRNLTWNRVLSPNLVNVFEAALPNVPWLVRYDRSTGRLSITCCHAPFAPDRVASNGGTVKQSHHVGCQYHPLGKHKHRRK